ncbi:hypothetical protein [Streptomyces solincola]|uniref:hypothetical protein n=1 Tax=Streptomyces solincola TaxID=2100817 RepID=UPI0011B25F94|nr:hypothetical protein [Streptomyces solincola]
MTGDTQQLRILEEDMGADAITFENFDEGVTYLFVRPGQSFENAVKAVLKACPEMKMPQAQDLVRTYCPNIIEMNERLGVDQVVPRFEAAPDAGVVPPVPMKVTGQHRRPRPPRWAKVAAVAAPALAGGMLLAHWLNPSPKDTSAATSAPAISQDDKVAAGTYRNPTFEKIAEGGQMKCDPMGAYEAKCVDADGKVMFSEASVGTSTAFTFSYDMEKIGFRLFPDVDSAAAWAAEDANKDLYQNVKQYGRVVLWGTDGARLGEWGSILEEQERQQRNQARAMGGQTPAMAPMSYTSAAPLPDRLAFLAFGTLGVTEETIHQAVHQDDAQSVQLLRAVDLVLGNADSGQLGIIPSGPTDAVAIVADATAPPAEDATDTHGETNPVPVGPTPEPPVTPDSGAKGEPSTSTPGGSSSGGTETAPPPETKPVVEPTAPEEPSEPPVPAPKPEPEPTPEPKPEPEPESPETDSRPGAVTPAPEPEPTEPQPAPAPEQPVTEVPPAPVTEVPVPETPPAPPVTEEPEDDGLSLEVLPTQWAAA